MKQRVVKSCSGFVRFFESPRQLVSGISKRSLYRNKYLSVYKEQVISLCKLYLNRVQRSGFFSCAWFCYDTYILLNYTELDSFLNIVIAAI